MKAESEILESYWSVLKKLSEDVKLNLIEKLQNSLKTLREKDEMDKSFGAWEGNESAEDLIQKISESRKFNRKQAEF